jgi:hypothetical protein
MSWMIMITLHYTLHVTAAAVIMLLQLNYYLPMVLTYTSSNLWQYST